jgi:uncharacterized glyoxalase superfamily metalloenzyme YdcJ
MGMYPLGHDDLTAANVPVLSLLGRDNHRCTLFCMFTPNHETFEAGLGGNTPNEFNLCHASESHSLAACMSQPCVATTA